MEKRGQITAFIIIGVLLLVIVALFVYISAEDQRETIETEAVEATETMTAPPIKSYVEECIRKSAQDALYAFGLQGGYLELSEGLYVDLDYTQVAYSYFEGQDIALTTEDLNLQFTRYMKEAVAECVDDFKVFKAQGYTIEEGELTADMIIGKEDVRLNVDYPLTASLKGETTKIETYSIPTYNVRLPHIINITQEITRKAVDDPSSIDITYLSSLDVDVVSLIYREDTVVYFLKDPRSYLENKDSPYVYVFALKFKE